MQLEQKLKNEVGLPCVNKGSKSYIELESTIMSQVDSDSNGKRKRLGNIADQFLIKARSPTKTHMSDQNKSQEK